MSRYDDFRKTYAGYVTSELKDLARRPADLVPEARAALTDELDSRDPAWRAAPSAPDVIDKPSHRSWGRLWLTLFQLWVTANIVFATYIYFIFGPRSGGRLVVLLGLLAIPIRGLWLIATRSPAARRFWLTSLGVLILADAVVAVLIGWSGVRAVPNAVLTITWYVYWLKSKPVAATLGGSATASAG
jgi:hypothetical protein